MVVSVERAINHIQAVCKHTDCLNMDIKNRTLDKLSQLPPLLKSYAYLTAVLRISIPELAKNHAKMTNPTTSLPDYGIVSPKHTEYKVTR
ncbi:hypothetical protein [Snodgrassella alvi]|uniref:hypothetical protein n=1 Tax=Snodgrassella alvi TaxID=1196083 RepID=UPI000C1DEB3D|nr:hypothetical protein [Snodgrassella alvi]PIT42546.1 hypothetical protein BHC53_00885 [Snodgrassella alvi]